jgi:Leucine-rich repeat (LRR) protein
MGLDSLDSEVLNALHSLKVLDVSGNRLREIPCDVCLPNLKKLDCSENQLENLLFLAQLPSLQELHIMGNGLQVNHY